MALRVSNWASHRGKKRYPYHTELTVHRLASLHQGTVTDALAQEAAAGVELQVAWVRGSKISMTKPKGITESRLVVWEEDLNQTVTMFKDAKELTFQEKKYQLIVKEATTNNPKKGKFGKVLGQIHVDLSKYVGVETVVKTLELELELGGGGLAKSRALLTITLRTSWLQNYRPGDDAVSMLTDMSGGLSFDAISDSTTTATSKLASGEATNDVADLRELDQFMSELGSATRSSLCVEGGQAVDEEEDPVARLSRQLQEKEEHARKYETKLKSAYRIIKQQTEEIEVHKRRLRVMRGERGVCEGAVTSNPSHEAVVDELIDVKLKSAQMEERILQLKRDLFRARNSNMTLAQTLTELQSKYAILNNSYSALCVESTEQRGVDGSPKWRFEQRFLARFRSIGDSNPSAS
eukprot:Rmarinus@m.5645